MALNEDLDEQRLAAYSAMMEVGSLLEHAVAKQLRVDGGLSPVQFQILVSLEAGPPEGLRMTDIADAIVHSRSGLSYQAGLLESAGLIVRSPGADDERSTVVRLTVEGRALLEHVAPRHNAAVKALVFEGMADADLVTLEAALGRVRDRLRRSPSRSPTRSSRPRGQAPRPV